MPALHLLRNLRFLPHFAFLPCVLLVAPLGAEEAENRFPLHGFQLTICTVAVCTLPEHLCLSVVVLVVGPVVARRA